MSASLVASTVTPGSTAPVVSLTTPVMALWADAVAGQTATHASPTTNPKATVRIDSSFVEVLQDPLVSGLWRRFCVGRTPWFPLGVAGFPTASEERQSHGFHRAPVRN